MKKRTTKCPICGKENTEIYYLENYWGGLVISESYYYCSECGYREQKAYSPTYVGFENSTNFFTYLHQLYIRSKYRKKVKAILKSEYFLPSKVWKKI